MQDATPLAATPLAYCLCPTQAIHFDLAHTCAGIVQDSVINLLRGLRQYSSMIVYDQDNNGRFRDNADPWVATKADVASMQAALDVSALFAISMREGTCLTVVVNADDGCIHAIGLAGEEVFQHTFQKEVQDAHMFAVCISIR